MVESFLWNRYSRFRLNVELFAQSMLGAHQHGGVDRAPQHAHAAQCFVFYILSRNPELWGLFQDTDPADAEELRRQLDRAARSVIYGGDILQVRRRNDGYVIATLGGAVFELRPRTLAPIAIGSSPVRLPPVDGFIDAVERFIRESNPGVRRTGDAIEVTDAFGDIHRNLRPEEPFAVWSQLWLNHISLYS